MLCCAGSRGSHHYGFPSPDSDIDIKAIHLAPTRTLLGLARASDTHDALRMFRGTECDLTSHEAAKAVNLVLAGNGNLLERIFSPYQLIDDAEVQVLRVLAAGAMSQQCYGHYSGYFKGMQREHLRDGRVKSLLYTYRVALTGIHALNTGRIVADLPTLAMEYGFTELLDLVALKRSGGEKALADTSLAEPFRDGWSVLRAQLDGARDRSPLPEQSANRDACEAWLVGVRLGELDGS